MVENGDFVLDTDMFLAFRTSNSLLHFLGSVTVSRAAFGQNVWGAFMKRFVGFSHEKFLKSMEKVFGDY